MAFYCFVCEKPAENCCSRCKSLHYCSQACQKLNWPQHKKECGQMEIGETVYRFLRQHFAADIDAMMSRFGDIQISIGEDWQRVLESRGVPHFANIIAAGNGPLHINLCRISFKDVQVRRFEAGVARYESACAKALGDEPRERVIYFET